MKLYDEAFVTGCDRKHEWFLDWFIDNYKKHVNKWWPHKHEKFKIKFC